MSSSFDLCYYWFAKFLKLIDIFLVTKLGSLKLNDLSQKVSKFAKCTNVSSDHLFSQLMQLKLMMSNESISQYDEILP